MNEKLIVKNNTDIKRLNTLNKKKIIFVELPVYSEDILNPYNERNLNKESVINLSNIITGTVEKMDEEAILFIYGTPLQLMKANEIISDKIHFHYWVALDVGTSIENVNYTGIKHNHLGILIYSKNKSLALLDVKNTKFPHLGCLACNNNVKDWGGKKHLMNLNGTGLSDVWKDLYITKGTRKDKVLPQIKLNQLDIKKSLFSKSLVCPNEVKDRIKHLSNSKQNGFFEIKVDRNYLGKINNPKSLKLKTYIQKPINELNNKVLLGDCIVEMEKLSEKYPDGLFDLVFADPPYNLAKNYKEYDDERTSVEYENWCNRWIELCVKLTKPTGSIFVLNIPKWGLSHAKILNKLAYFRNWIVWDALSTPKGKIMPAHYSLLYYTKSPNNQTFNRINKNDPVSYCLRSTCQKTREKDLNYLNSKLEISEIWHDIHRIKHKKDRDDHPCQLPHKLMDRIIQMFTNTGDLVFDPFGGAGTTGICALKNKRSFLLTELDPYYKEISEKMLKETIETGHVTRVTSKKIIKSMYTKKFLETKVQELSSTLKRKPTFDEFVNHFELKKQEIEKMYSNPNIVLKAARVGMLNQMS